MRKWLVLAVVLPLWAATAANAQMKGLGIADVATVARTRALDLRVADERSFDAQARMTNGMIAQQNVAPNAIVGVGLARIYGRKKRGDARISDPPSVGRKPAVTFVLKF